MSKSRSVWLRRCVPLLVAMLMGSVFIPSRPTQGYGTTFRWGQGVFSGTYRVDARIADNLNGLRGQFATVRGQIDGAAFEWSISSNFKLTNNPNSASTWTAADLGFNPNLVIYADAVQVRSSFRIVSGANSRLNNNQAVIWNTNGNFTFQPNSATASVQNVARHEFGHWLAIDHPRSTFPPGSDPNRNTVMRFPGLTSSGLFIDDKMAAVLLYGMATGFETAQYLGESPNQAARNPPALGVGAYSACSGSPAYWTYSYGTADTNFIGKPQSAFQNLRAMRFDGCALAAASRSYAYMDLASSQYDGLGDDPNTPCGTPCYLQIRSGYNLRWLQYNYAQCTISLDIEFNDGTFLRDKMKQVQPGEFVPYTDTAGVSVHPADRSCSKYGQGNWFFVQIDLTPFQNLSIKRIIVGYDNSNNTLIRGNWRAYFDEVTLGP